MKKQSLFLIVIISINLSIAAQTKYQDIGLTYSGYNLFGIRYKSGNDKSHIRLTLINVGGFNQRSKDNSSDYRYNSQGFGFNFGFEKLRPVWDDVHFYYGPEFMTSLSNSTQRNTLNNTKTKDLTYTPGLGCVIGFVYYLTDHINFSAEIIPSMYYSISKQTYTDDNNESSQTFKTLGYGFNNGSWNNSFANVTLSFKLNKNPE